MGEVDRLETICVRMSLDMQKVKSLPIQKSLLLINNFVINTTKFLNAFSETCEKKISQVSSKATGLEIMLAVLEAKLNSIPDLEVMSSPQAAPSSSSQEQAQQPALSTDASPASAPQTTASSSSAAELEPTQHMGNLVKDDPAYGELHVLFLFNITATNHVTPRAKPIVYRPRCVKNPFLRC